MTSLDFGEARGESRGKARGEAKEHTSYSNSRSMYETVFSENSENKFLKRGKRKDDGLSIVHLCADCCLHV